MKENESE